MTGSSTASLATTTISMRPPITREHADVLSVDESVGYLCKVVAILCTGRERLGIPAPADAFDKATACGNTIHTLCTEGKRKLSTQRAAISHK